MKIALLSITGLLIPLVTSTPLLNVDVHVTDDTHVSNSPAASHHLQQVIDQTPVTSPATMSEKVAGWLFIEQTKFQARIHGHTFWNIKGKLEENFPVDEILYDPLIFTLNSPEDFIGKFNGTIGDGQITLMWEKGGMMKGRSAPDNFEIKGETSIDYSPLR